LGIDVDNADQMQSVPVNRELHLIINMTAEEGESKKATERGIDGVM
jgi:hypothetical protein